MSERTQTGYIVLLGTIGEGFTAYGPFAEFQDADWFSLEHGVGSDFCIMPLHEWTETSDE